MKTLFCLISIILLLITVPIITSSAEGWPQWRGENRDGIWNETGLLSEFDENQIPHRWSVPIGSGYSGPTVANGRVYVTDKLTKPKHIERVLCFDWETGDEIWSYSYDCIYRIDYAAGPRANVTVQDGLAFALGAMGHLHCF